MDKVEGGEGGWWAIADNPSLNQLFNQLNAADTADVRKLVYDWVKIRGQWSFYDRV